MTKKTLFCRVLREAATSRRWAMRDSNNVLNAEDCAPFCDALQMRCNSVGFPELAKLLAVFDELPTRGQMRCRRRVRQICIEAREQLAARRAGNE